MACRPETSLLLLEALKRGSVIIRTGARDVAFTVGRTEGSFSSPVLRSLRVSRGVQWPLNDTKTARVNARRPRASIKSEEYVVPRRTTYREDSANKKALRSFLFVSAPFLRALCLHRTILAFEGIRDSAGNRKGISLRRLPDNHHRRHRRADELPTCYWNMWLLLI